MVVEVKVWLDFFPLYLKFVYINILCELVEDCARGNVAYVALICVKKALI